MSILCCFEPSWPGSDAGPPYYNQQQPQGGMSGYPGLRSRTPMAPLQHQQSQQPLSPQSNGDLFEVTVPVGVTSGQCIHVLHPDGSGQVIKAEVPQGLRPGDKFYVKSPQSDLPSSPAVFATPMSPPTSTAPHPPTAASVPVDPPSAAATLVHMEPTSATPPNRQSPPPFSEALDSQYQGYNSHLSDPPQRPTPVSTNMPTETNNGAGMKLVEVIVPPGTRPGSTIHVQIPGENRLVAAQVPPNCSRFHVQYDPRETPVSVGSPASQTRRDVYPTTANPPPHSPDSRDYQHRAPSYSGTSSQVQPNVTKFPAQYGHREIPMTVASPVSQTSRDMYPTAMNPLSYSAVTRDSQHHAQPYSGTSAAEKLILVRVPPGVRPGSMIQVEIPDEPGRFLEARVPPNASEFHVSYVPSRNGMNAHASSRHMSNVNSSNQTQTRSGQGDWLLPIAGGMAGGIAGGMLYDFFTDQED